MLGSSLPPPIHYIHIQIIRLISHIHVYLTTCILLFTLPMSHPPSEVYQFYCLANQTTTALTQIHVCFVQHAHGSTCTKKVDIFCFHGPSYILANFVLTCSITASRHAYRWRRAFHIPCNICRDGGTRYFCSTAFV